MASRCGVSFVSSCLIPCSYVCSGLCSLAITLLADDFTGRLIIYSGHGCLYSLSFLLGIECTLRILIVVLTELLFYVLRSDE